MNTSYSPTDISETKSEITITAGQIEAWTKVHDKTDEILAYIGDGFLQVSSEESSMSPDTHRLVNEFSSMWVYCERFYKENEGFINHPLNNALYQIQKTDVLFRWEDRGVRDLSGYVGEDIGSEDFFEDTVVVKEFLAQNKNIVSEETLELFLNFMCVLADIVRLRDRVQKILGKVSVLLAEQHSMNDDE